MHDSQFGIARVLRPYLNFEDIYQGQTSDIPIVLSEGGIPLDEQAVAGVAGIDPRLVRGLAVPFGAKIRIWVPSLLTTGNVPYIYTLNWRLRSTTHYQSTKAPFHLPDDSGGITETIVSAGNRFVIPALNESVEYQSAEVGITGTQTQDIHLENFNGGALPLANNPINPDGSLGAIEQGILPSAGSGSHLRANYTLITIDEARGDELVVLVTRPTGGGTWAFLTTDLQFSQYYGRAVAFAGFKNLGAYVLVGSTS